MSLYVMTCAARQTQGLVLAASIQAGVAHDPGATIAPSPLRAARIAWLAASQRGKWACVLQDDALPIRGFGPLMVESLYQQASRCAGGPAAVALYYGAQSSTGRAIQRRAASLEDRNDATPFVRRARGEYQATVGLIVPSEWVADWLRYSWTREWADSGLDDECWGTWLDDLNLPSLATVPCLVDHDNTLPSVAGNEAHGARYAAVPVPKELPSWYA